MAVNECPSWHRHSGAAEAVWQKKSGHFIFIFCACGREHLIPPYNSLLGPLSISQLQKWVSVVA